MLSPIRFILFLLQLEKFLTKILKLGLPWSLLKANGRGLVLGLCCCSFLTLIHNLFKIISCASTTKIRCLTTKRQSPTTGCILRADKIALNAGWRCSDLFAFRSWLKKVVWKVTEARLKKSNRFQQKFQRKKGFQFMFCAEIQLKREKKIVNNFLFR